MFGVYGWLIPLLPFFGLPFIPILEYYKKNLGAYLAIVLVGISTILSYCIFIDVFGGKIFSFGWGWISLGGSTIVFGFYYDYLNTFMSIVVSTISLLVLIYSIGYMEHEHEKSRLALPRYYVEITFFIGSMLGLVASLNLLEMYLFWEFVGLASYLLIGYWWYKPSAARAAKKAFIVTRFGDVFFSAAVVYSFLYLHTLDVVEINTIAASGANTLALTLMAFMLFGGAMGKSAQFPLHIWLPDAMEGPTTVSALIHAATMVKAGVYLVARFYPVFQHSGSLYGVYPLEFVAFIGGFTAFLAGIFALAATGIKRVLAYSTISHLGFMFLALGIGAYSAALFHLLNHAFFKALLFLVAGSVMHGMNDINDITRMGGLYEKMKITAITGLIGALAMSGIPPFNGFWSKEAVLHWVNLSGNGWIFFLGFGSAALSVLYIFRWWFMIFVGKPRSEEAVHANESPRIMTWPLIVLAIGATITGFFGWIVPKLNVEGLVELAIIPEEFVAVTSLSIVFVGFLIVLSIYYYNKPSPEIFSRNPILNAIRISLYKAFWIDDALVKLTEILFGNRAYVWFDNNIVDGFVRGIVKLFSWTSMVVGWIQTGVIRQYLLILLATLTITVALIYIGFFPFIPFL